MPARPSAVDRLTGPVRITARVTIPADELLWQASRAGGPGGQHVNRSSTKVELTWDIRTSRAVGATERTRLLERLAPRLDSTGTLRVVSAETRSQLQNRVRALDRLITIVAEALREPKVRRATRPTRGSVEARLTSKRRQTERKRDRRWRDDD